MLTVKSVDPFNLPWAVFAERPPLQAPLLSCLLVSLPSPLSSQTDGFH